MCTAITFRSWQMENLFGRTMDFSYDIAPELYVMPPDYTWQSTIEARPIQNRYGFIGIGQETEGILGFFDGVNEMGFAAAALYFAGYAEYQSQGAIKDRRAVAAFEFLHYILGQCASLKELEELFESTQIMGVPDPVTKTVAPLHWMATDRSGKSAVIELMSNGARFTPNPIGVMANSPNFEWHMTNLRNYLNVSPLQENEAQWGDVVLRPFGQGAGTMALPGGYTSPERFVRTAYLKTHTEVPQSPAEAVAVCFHIMESVSIPKGAVITDRGTYDFTRYTAFMNTAKGEYYFSTYHNPQIATARLFDEYRHFQEPVRLGEINRPLVFEQML